MGLKSDYHKLKQLLRFQHSCVPGIVPDLNQDFVGNKIQTVKIKQGQT